MAVKRILDFFKGVVLVSAVFILVGPVMRSMGAQSPILVVDTAVQNRLATEWEPTNPYQHERAYCLTYTTEYRFTWGGPVVIYTLTSVVRAYEENTTPNSIGRMRCPKSVEPWIFMHVHPPTECNDDNEMHCHIGGAWSSQCYPSSTDLRTLNKTDQPLGIIQCDAHALVPFMRSEPIPLVDTSGAHR